MTGPLDPDLLLAQSAWVRRLARTLVADDPTADDVMQDTMVAALEHPPRIGGPGNSLRAWLSTVARRLAHRRGRSDTRRDERERGAARPVEVPSVDHVLAIEGSRRKLVEHVLALDDLYRDAILLRYFDELSPAEIAHRIGVRDSTVRNRLRRGLALLHERLEREQGEHWRQWCLLLVPAGSSGTGSPAVSWTGASAGLFAMGTKLALLLVSVAAALATILGWRALAPNASPAIAVRPAPPVTTVARAPVEKVEAQAANVRGSQPVASAPAPEVAPVGILSFGAVRTREGQPVISGTVWIEDPIGRQRQCDLDARGWYSFAGLGPGAWTLRASCDGFRPFDLPVELSQDRSVERRDLTLDAAALLGVRIRVAPGKQTSSNPLGPRFTVVATRNVPSARLAETAARSHMRYGIGQYRESQPFWGRDERIPEGCDGLLTVDEPLPCCVSLVLRHLVIETQVVPAGATSVDFLVDPDAASKLLARARVGSSTRRRASRSIRRTSR
jgi:RNA polymerase sigma factor (sigma-70 family)